jgi:RNA-directed DNA polymerase
VAKRYRNLIGTICSDQNMREALRLTARGKQLSPGHLDFNEFAPLNLEMLATDMRRGEYRPGTPHEFRILDPKPRLITALPFRDRVAQQALCLVIGPIFDRLLLPRCYACRPGKGTHAAAREVQATIRRIERLGLPAYFLKTDFSRYFASIELPVLWRLIDKKISCRATLRLLEAMVPRRGHRAADRLADVADPRQCLHRRDARSLPAAGARRDRLVSLHGRRRGAGHLERAVCASSRIDRALFGRAFGLRFSKWSIAPASRGINFLGYRIWADHKLLRTDSVVRARRKIAAYRAAGDTDRLQRFLGAWLGHASHADTRNLIRALGVGE